jgi:hypothetical protein
VGRSLGAVVGDEQGDAWMDDFEDDDFDDKDDQDEYALMFGYLRDISEWLA